VCIKIKLHTTKALCHFQILTSHVIILRHTQKGTYNKIILFSNEHSLKIIIKMKNYLNVITTTQ